MKRLFPLLLLTVLTAVSANAQDVKQLTTAEINAMYKAVSRSRASVHDPSVAHTTGSTFYIMGSHNGFARSTDNMQSWSGQSNNYYGRVDANGRVVSCSYADAYSVNQTTEVTALVNGQPTKVPFGPFDAKAWGNADQEGWNISGNMWAPDLIYNTEMQKWCMYMSVNGDLWHSVIVLLTSSSITGPYVYQGPVVYSGFRNTTIPEINWKKTDLELVIGEQETLPARYNVGNNWGTYWPNNIDPCVFYDETGKLWMSYGSWSGGIFMLELDEQTGLRDYTVQYPTQNDSQGRALSDPYFGIRIAGGYYSSGEGSYIQHIGDYYYLFMSYGGYAPGGYDDNGNPQGGYEMRTFRSTSPTGPYLDATNHDACYNGRYWLNFGPTAQTDGGMKLFGSYNNWGFQTVGECAQGHNSAIIDSKGRSFVIYHTKFNNGTYGHQVRTRQLFLNQQGWLCAAPFEFDGETVNDDSIASGCPFTKEQIAGEYDILIHKYRMDYEHFEEVTPVKITLTSNGRITGAYSGSWSMTDGTAYIRLVLGSTTYNGVVVEQTVDGTTMKAICFTGTANTGVSLWGYKVMPQYAIAYTAKTYTLPVKNGQSVNGNLPLFGKGSFGATIEWESSHPTVIDNTGKFNPADTATKVVLTCRISAEDYVYEQLFNVTAQRATALTGDYSSGIAAYYNFDEKPILNLYDESQRVTYGRKGTNGTTAASETDPERFGSVAHVFSGSNSSSSFARMPNPLQGRNDLEGFTVSMWVKRADADVVNALWGFTDVQSNLASVKQRLYFGGNASLDFISDNDYFHMNAATAAASSLTSYLPQDEWALVTLTVSATDGISLYVNGARKVVKSFESSAGTASSAAAAARLFDYTKVIGFIESAGFFQLGLSSTEGSAEAYFDDVLIYDRALSATDVSSLNRILNRVNDLSPQGVGIESVDRSPINHSDDAVYDLTGRQLSNCKSSNRPIKKGLYIVGGKKVIVR